MPSTKALRERRGQLRNRFKEIINRAEGEDRDITADEQRELNKINADDIELKNRIDRQEDLSRREMEDSQPIDRRGSGGVGQRLPLENGPGGFRFVDSNGVERQALRPQDSFSAHVRKNNGSDDREGALSVGRVIQAVATGRLDRLNDGIHNAAVSTVGSGGYLLVPSLGSQLVDLARSASVCIAAGAQTLPMTTPELRIARLLSDPSPSWRAEGSNVAVGDVSFGAFILTAKTLAVRVPITQELLEDAGNIQAVLTGSIQAAMGLALDQACIAGANFSFFPGGILSVGGTHTQTGIGTPTDYGKFSKGIGDILGANFPGNPAELTWIQRPDLATALDQLTATDSGQPLQPTPFCQSVKKAYTTGLPDGTSVIGHFPSLLIGMRTDGVRLQLTQAGNDADGTPLADKLMMQLICYLRADVIVLRPGWFSILKGITLT